MLFKHYCQKKTTNFIQTFLEHPLLWHYCIHLPEDQHPLLGWLIAILTSLDSLQLLPLGIFLSQFQFPLHFPYSVILICVLWPPPCPPIPISQSPSSQFSSPNFSPCLLNHQPLLSPVCTATSPLPHPCSWFAISFLLRYIPKLFFLPPQGFSSVSVFSGSHSLLSNQLVEKNPSYRLADNTEDRGETISQLQLWTWHNRSALKLKIREIFLSPRADHTDGILLAKT